MSDPLLLDIPTTIATARLELRAPRAGDGPALNAAIIASFAELRVWLPWATELPTIADNEAWSRRGVARFTTREEIGYRLIERASGALIGVASLMRGDWSVPRMEIGYWLRSDRAGRGYMSEAVAALTAAGFAFGLRRIELRCDPRNRRSAAVAERCGYRLEGTLRHDARDPSGALRDTLIYARWPSDGEPQP